MELYDITPTWTDEPIFAEAHRALAELLPGGGSLAERLAAKKRETEIPVARARAAPRDLRGTAPPYPGKFPPARG